MKPFLLISFSMPRGLKQMDFYEDILIFNDGKLNFECKNITNQKIEKRRVIPYKEKDLEKMLDIASKSSSKPAQMIMDMSLAYAEIRDVSGKIKRVFVSDPLFWEIAYRYLPRNI
ncbi:MAG TPA: hypothetical protein DDW18_04240 [Firmicutes bacterium]|nr:hypothetical protein [Bacillota bacterium]